MQQTKKLGRWVCPECAYIYDLVKGDRKNGISPGVPFEELPRTWRCPECNLSIEQIGILKRLDDWLQNILFSTRTRFSVISHIG